MQQRLTLLKDECACLANCDEVNYVIEDVDTREWFLGAIYIGGMTGLFFGVQFFKFYRNNLLLHVKALLVGS
ncbi:hypothetical protein NQ318_001581 [Aromia moschata]|uniref:Uncharacterized protein n=1 Tax=Aromia moschata TaxID=1265417 RepID=A0AAV8Y3F4_9CUCU|nr:hypothetical protein NQ318_001581 [Aromia moschata]